MALLGEGGVGSSQPLPCKDKFLVMSVSLHQDDLVALGMSHGGGGSADPSPAGGASGGSASLSALWGKRDWKGRARQAKLTVRVYRPTDVSDDDSDDDGGSVAGGRAGVAGPDSRRRASAGAWEPLGGGDPGLVRSVSRAASPSTRHGGGSSRGDAQAGDDEGTPAVNGHSSGAASAAAASFEDGLPGGLSAGVTGSRPPRIRRTPSLSTAKQHARSLGTGGDAETPLSPSSSGPGAVGATGAGAGHPLAASPTPHTPASARGRTRMTRTSSVGRRQVPPALLSPGTPGGRSQGWTGSGVGGLVAGPAIPGGGGGGGGGGGPPGSVTGGLATTEAAAGLSRTANGRVPAGGGLLASPASGLPPLAVGAVMSGRPMGGRDQTLTGRSTGGPSLSLALSARSGASFGSYQSATTGGRSYGSVALDMGAGTVAPAELFADGGFASIPKEGLPAMDGFAWRAGPELGRGISGHVHVGLRLGGKDLRRAAAPDGKAPPPDSEPDGEDAGLRDGLVLPAGQGGLGQLMQAQASLIAVKMVEVTTVGEQRSLEREIRVLRALRHPNVVSWCALSRQRALVRAFVRVCGGFGVWFWCSGMRHSYGQGCRLLPQPPCCCLLLNTRAAR